MIINDLSKNDTSIKWTNNYKPYTQIFHKFTVCCFPFDAFEPFFTFGRLYMILNLVLVAWSFDIWRVDNGVSQNDFEHLLMMYGYVQSI